MALCRTNILILIPNSISRNRACGYRGTRRLPGATSRSTIHLYDRHTPAKRSHGQFLKRSAWGLSAYSSPKNGSLHRNPEGLKTDLWRWLETCHVGREIFEIGCFSGLLSRRHVQRPQGAATLQPILSVRLRVMLQRLTFI